MPADQKPKILILSGDLGEGHKQAANALLEASQIAQPDTEVVVVDFLQLIYPNLHITGTRLYIQGLKSFPSVYGYLYTKTRKPNLLSLLFKKLRFYGFAPLIKLLEEVQPTVVVSTFPIAAEAMSRLIADGISSLPTITVITDHTDHNYWIHPFTDRYIVGSNRVRASLLNLHIADKQISVTGIPVRSQFDQSYDRLQLCDKYGLDPNIPIIMVMGGGYGMMGDGLSKLLSSDELPKKKQFIIICGHNAKLKEKLTEELAHSKHRILLTGYIHHVHEFMAVSDLIITKPGGVTISEAIALELPMLLYRSHPGQEQDNAEFLVESGTALQADHEEDLSAKINYLFDHPYHLLFMKTQTKHIQSKRAAFKALDSILQTKSTLHTEVRIRMKQNKPPGKLAFLKMIKRKNRIGVR